jgi:hypothetical protein
MWAAAGFAGLILPGVAVAFICVLLPVILWGVAGTAGAGEHAANTKAKVDSNKIIRVVMNFSK